MRLIQKGQLWYVRQKIWTLTLTEVFYLYWSLEIDGSKLISTDEFQDPQRADISKPRPGSLIHQKCFLGGFLSSGSRSGPHSGERVGGATSESDNGQLLVDYLLQIPIQPPTNPYITCKLHNWGFLKYVGFLSVWYLYCGLIFTLYCQALGFIIVTILYQYVQPYKVSISWTAKHQLS